MNFFSILIDVLIVLVFLAVTLFFSKHGLDRAIHMIGKAWLSVACALFVGPKITAFLENLFIREGINSAVHASLTDLIEHNTNGYNLAQLFDNLPSGFVRFLDGLGASLSTLEAEFGSYTEAGPEIIRAMAERIAAPCIGAISTVIGSFLGFIIPFLFFKWIEFEIKKDDSHMFFKVLDHVGGVIVGLAAGYALVLGISLLTRTAFQVIVAFDASIPVMDVYNSSFIFKFLAESDTFGAIGRLVQTVATSVDNFIH